MRQLTRLLSVWRYEPVIGPFQGAIAGELQAGIGEDGDHGGSQAFVEDEGALGLIHGAYGLSQIVIDLPMHMHSVSEPCEAVSAQVQPKSIFSLSKTQLPGT